MDLGGRTLPGHARCSIPSRTVVVLSEVLHHKVVSVDLHDVVERSAGPRVEASAVRKRFLCLALHEGIGSCCAKACHEVVASLTCVAALHEALLAHHVERCASQACILAYGLQVLAVLHGDATCRRLHHYARSCQVPEVDQSHPAVVCIFERDARPAVVFVVCIPWVKARFERQVFDARFADFSQVVHDSHIAGTHGHVLVQLLLVVDVRSLLVGVKAHRQWCIELQGISIHANNRSAPKQVDVTGLPRQGIDAASVDAAPHLFDPGG